MNDETTILVEDRGGIRWLTVSRPTALNALNRRVLAELREAVEAVRLAADVRAVVITGAGEKAFVAGADIREFEAATPAEMTEMARLGQSLFAAIESLPKPVIAAVNGFALGGGCELAMACHLRVAARSARFGQPEVKLGLIPGYGGTQRLARLVGRGRALEMLLTGRMLDADTALSWGLVNRVVEPGELREATERLAAEIMAMSPVAVGRAIEAVNGGADLELGRACEIEAALFGLCAASGDRHEGVAAFLEKRSPQFQGR